MAGTVAKVDLSLQDYSSIPKDFRMKVAHLKAT